MVYPCFTVQRTFDDISQKSLHCQMNSKSLVKVHCQMGNTISLWSSKTCRDGPNSLCQATWLPENVLWRPCSVSNLYMIGRYWYCAYAWSTLSWTGPWSDWVLRGVSWGRTLQKEPNMNHGGTTHCGQNAAEIWHTVCCRPRRMLHQS